jgi:regulator of RNase E activity RraA
VRPAPDLSPVDPETERLLKEVTSATLATVLFIHGFKNQVIGGVTRLRPGGPRMVGVARTLRYIAARDDLETLELWKRDDNPQRRIADEIEPGQVLVIDARGDQRAGTMGGMLVARMQAKGAAGIVSDGPYRDGPFIAGLDMPSYSSGYNANTNLIAHHPEDLDLAITCGGVQVRRRRPAAPGRAGGQGGAREGAGGGVDRGADPRRRSGLRHLPDEPRDAGAVREGEGGGLTPPPRPYRAPEPPLEPIPGKAYGDPTRHVS